jgi:hypothetical protein
MDYVTRQFINLTKKLRKEIRMALSTIDKSLKDQTKAIRELTDANQQGQYPPPILRTELKVPQADRYKQEADSARKLIIEYWKLYAEIIGITIVIAYTTVAALQLREIIKQYPEIQKSADAADKSATAAKISADSIRLEDRPYVIFDKNGGFIINPAPEIVLSVNVTFKNVGKTPAINVCRVSKLFRRAGPFTVQQTRTFFDSNFESLWHDCRTRQTEMEGLHTSVDIAPGDSTFATTQQKDVVIHSSEWQAFQLGNVVVIVLAVAGYKDRLGGDYATEACYYYFGSVPSIWHQCDAYNTIK